MVSASVDRAAGGVSKTLDDRDLKGAVYVATFGAAGIMAGQRLADEAAGLAGFNTDPSTLTDYAGHIGTKGAGAALASAAYYSMDGTVSTIAGTLAFGMLASAGVDLVELVMNQLEGFTSGGTSSMVSKTPSRPQVKRASGPSRGSSGRSAQAATTAGFR